MGGIFGVYMLYYISWEWQLAFGMLAIGVFTGISSVVFFFTVCCFLCALLL